MSEALRAVFAEFGFDIPLDVLEKADAKLKAVIGTTKKGTKASDESAKSSKKAGKAAAKGAEDTAAATKKALKPIESYADLLKRVDEVSSEALGARLAPRIEELTKRFPPLNAALTRFGVDAKNGASVARVLVGGTLATIAVMKRAVSAAFDFADAFSADAEALRDTARESRVTTSELQGLDHAAVQAGVGVDRMRSGIATFGASLRSAERWGNGTTWTLRRLGINARDANGKIRPTVDLLDEVAVGLERVQNPFRRARVAQQLFGESGRRMLDVLHSGPGGVRALREDLAELGGGITPEATEASRQYTQQTERLQRASDSLRSVLAVALLPALSWIVGKGAALAGLWARLTHGTHVVQIAIAALAAVGVVAAGAMIVAWLPVILPILKVAAIVGILIAVIDDLITFIEGGDSATGRLIDSLFGVGTAARWVRELRDDWESVVGAVEKAIAAVARFTGIESAPGVGTLRASTLGGPARRGGATGSAPASRAARALVASGAGSAVAAAVTRTAPATQTVAAPAAVTQRTTVRSVSRQTTNHFNLAGTGARQLADEVAQRLQRQERDQRDADHPHDDEEDA